MKFIFSFLFFILAVNTFSQYAIKGSIVDENGASIPGVRVAVENTTYGVPANSQGFYFLEVPSPGTYVLTFTMLSFEKRSDTIVVKNQITYHETILYEKSTELGTVEIYADKKDIAKEVIGYVIDNKKNLGRAYETYQCDTYIKTSLEKESRFPFMGATDTVGKQRMNLIESYSVTHFKQNTTYHEEVIAHHDYAEKANSTVMVSVDFANPDNLVPNQAIEYNPYIFFEKVADGDVDPYQNLIDLPKISSKQLVSPVAVNAFVNYKYTLESVFYEDKQKIYEIKVEPRFKEGPLFSGTLFIIDSLWVIKSMDLSVNAAAMDYFKEFRIIQDFENIDGNWVATRREFTYTINDGMDYVMANTRVQHSNYLFNKGYDEKLYKNSVMSFSDDAFDRDSLYWISARPIQLKPEELRYIYEQDSIEKELSSFEHIDSLNAEYNRLTVWDFLLNGVGFRNREKAREIYFSPLISQPQFFGFGPYRHKLAGYYSKEFENGKSISVNAEIDYGFKYQDLKGMVGFEYTYLPKHFGSLKVSGGDVYDLVNSYESIVNTGASSNFVRKTFFAIGQRYEIVNGLYGRLSYDYSTRIAVPELARAPWLDSLMKNIGSDIQAKHFETYTVSIFELELLYRFKQAYIIKKGKKIVIGTEFPELKLNYKIGVPGLFGSDVNFSFLELGASDEITFGTFGNMKWNFLAGSFLGSNIADIRFIEHKFFRGSDFFFFSNPLKSLQLLDSTRHTAHPYLQAFVIHHFNGAITDKIPLINKTKIELVAGGGLLMIDDADYSHLEFYMGIERKFKIKKQLFKVSAFYVLRDNGAPSVQLNFKFGLDFYNSFTNSWSY
ncbi:MAG: carboxypeptidase-like regulatory domain-containing protein [Crocinitomicaceae bacterium]|nr:carboxypeptidase-like regulatory domain-containing protein [Crocinitomicaceae bacterium]